MSGGPDDEALVRQLRQARHIAQCREADLDRARSELVATRARAAAFASQNAAAARRLAACEQAVAERREAASPVTNEAELRAEIARLEQHRDEARRLRASLSWRVARPLRALRRPRRTLRILIDRLRS
jgi:uncharacterized damage-inducible protein DinB